MYPGAPILVGRKRIAESSALQAVIINNKISNVCAAGDGVADSEALCTDLATALSLEGGASAVVPCSTGVIGWRLPIAAMREALPAAVAALESSSLLPAARSIMTTDRFPKLRAASACGGRIVGIAKGAGMIEPSTLHWMRARKAVPIGSTEPSAFGALPAIKRLASAAMAAKPSSRALPLAAARMD